MNPPTPIVPASEEGDLEIAPPGEFVVEALRRGHQSYARAHRGVGEAVSAQHHRAPFLRRDETREYAHERGLAAPVGAHDAGDAGAQREAHVAQPHDLAVEDAHIGEDDGIAGRAADRRSHCGDCTIQRPVHGIISRRTARSVINAPSAPYAARTAAPTTPRIGSRSPKSARSNSTAALPGPAP